MKFVNMHACTPINGIDLSGYAQRKTSLRKEVIKAGRDRKTVTIALPLFYDEASGEENVLRILLDTGSDGDLFFPTKRLLKLFETVEGAYPVTWGTSNGKFTTRKRAVMRLLLPEFSQTKIFDVTPDVKVVDDDQTVSYDLIIGIETLFQWGCVLDFRDSEITIDNQTIPMRPQSALSTRKEIRNTYLEAVEPLSTKEETERVTRILDAKYEAADLPKVVEENCPHLSQAEKKALLEILLKYSRCFRVR